MIWAQRCRAALVGALAATCVTLVPDAALADPTNEEPTEGMLEHRQRQIQILSEPQNHENFYGISKIRKTIKPAIGQQSA